MEQLKKIVKEYGFDLEEVAFVGNDINDLSCMKEAGLTIAVADAEQSVRAAADFITKAPGGHGAVREVAELLIQSRKIMVIPWRGEDGESQNWKSSSRTR